MYCDIPSLGASDWHLTKVRKRGQTATEDLVSEDSVVERTGSLAGRRKTQ